MPQQNRLRQLEPIQAPETAKSLDIKYENSCGSRLEGGSHAHQLARDWLEGHNRILHFWLERLIAENGDVTLIESLHCQSNWLSSTLEKI